MPCLRCLRSRATFNWCPLFPFIQRARAGWEQKLPYSYRGRPSLNLVSFLADEDETIKISWRQQSCLVKTPQGVGYLELKQSQPGSLRTTKIIRVASSEILKMKPSQRYFLSLSLKLASNQLRYPARKPWETQQGKTGRVLAENTFSGITYVKT